MTKSKAPKTASRTKAKKSNAPEPGAENSIFLAPHEMAAAPGIQNAVALEPWTVFGALDIGELTRELEAATRKVTRDDDMRGAEAMLYGQAMALQAIFTNLSRRAARNAGEYMGATETYLRLALKAQAQCRSTLETLAAVKNPPVVFARQANINNGGQQQVNNGSAQNVEPPMSGAARAQEADIKPNELLEGDEHALACTPRTVSVAEPLAGDCAGPSRE